MVKKEELDKQFLFHGLSSEHLDLLAKSLGELSLKKGEVLFREGEEARGIYLIRSGKISISKKTADGWKQTLAMFTPGHFFGELSIMEKRIHESDATAAEDTSLLLLSVGDFDRIEAENKDLALGIIKKIAITMSKNLRRMNNKFLEALINY